MTQVVRRATAYERMLATILGAFAVVALVLAAIAVYATVAYVARRRAHEFALRAALGEPPDRLLRRAIRSAAVVGLGGVGVGTIGAALCSRAMSAYLYGLSSVDAIAAAASALVLAGVITAAAYFPARWVLTLDPATVLRQD